MEHAVISGMENKANQMMLSVRLDQPYYRVTPIERVVGFDVAEHAYDLLNFREQLILDLLAAEWSQTQIAGLFGVSQPSIASSVRRIRFKLADSKLRMILDLRQNYREGR